MALDLDAVVRGFESHSLPKHDWTHEAHLAVCWATLGRLEPPAALAHLRASITSYNESVGTVNSESSGYHETLTRYYVGAVGALRRASVDESGFADVLAHPWCTRSAPSLHWTRDRMFSVPARMGWVDPDLEPLPFEVPGDITAAGRAGAGSRTRGRSRPAPG